MIEIFEPISRIPGVRLAGVITSDGVPIVTPGMANDESEGSNAMLDIDALSAIAVQWFDEVARMTGELTWDRPARAVLRGARGTLVVRTVRGGVLLALLDSGVGAEELRLPMEGAAARIARVLRNMGGNCETMQAAPERGAIKTTKAPLPSGSGSKSNGEHPMHSGDSETSTQPEAKD